MDDLIYFERCIDSRKKGRWKVEWPIITVAAIFSGPYGGSAHCSLCLSPQPTQEPSDHELLAALSLVVATAITVDASSLRSVEDAERRLVKMEYMTTMSPPLNCFIENGFDYIGYDIKSVQGQPVENCCGICFSMNGYRAYSWTNQNGGTCWLKSGRGEIVSNPNVKSALFSTTANDNPSCQLANDLDYVGNDIGRASASDAGQCCDICQKRSGCRAYTWTGQDGGTCWLKSKRGETTYKAGAKSAEAYPADSGNNSPPPAKCDLVKDVDFVGNDVGSPEPGATADQCCTICKSRSACKAFTWTNQNGGTCYLKKRCDNHGQQAGCRVVCDRLNAWTQAKVG